MAETNDIYRTGIIGQFNLSFELAWKALQEIMRMHGIEEASTGSPREILQLAYNIGFILSLIHIFVTHSPILLGIPDANIYCFDNGRIHLCKYEETESYQVTEMFINNRQMLLNKLLKD